MYVCVYVCNTAHYSPGGGPVQPLHETQTLETGLEVLVQPCSVSHPAEEWSSGNQCFEGDYSWEADGNETDR